MIYYRTRCISHHLTQFLIINAQSGRPEEYSVEGTTYSPYGSITSAKGQVADLQSDPLRRLAEISAICNDAKIVFNYVSPTTNRCFLSSFMILGQEFVL